MDVILHRVGVEEPEVVEEVAETWTVREFLERVGAGSEDRLWIEDEAKELDVDVTLAEAGVGAGPPVIHHPCRAVDVAVWFAGRDKPRTFPPSTTVKRVLDWALGEHGFNIPRDQWENYELRKEGGDHPLDPWVHVGSLTDREGCRVVLELVLKHNPQG